MSLILPFSTSRIVALPGSISSSSSSGTRNLAPPRVTNGGLVIECSSRPRKKATSHHMKTRPRKSQPWDIKRKPTVYAPLPPLPPDWTLVPSGASDSADAAEPGSAPPAQVTSG
ncbi:hypothetical protein SLEP1_g42000 [Rubroshorea leprosula]|uniref:50S ribosomal protein 6, chloroplastic n=1 Tax=Rubroshorea leprosula TaxID=152421 RepID=A0AAV5L9Q3_9ROSI|nr:hypothetical protein SLEP1_g42000 [Rubroshorea leprosula]